MRGSRRRRSRRRISARANNAALDAMYAGQFDTAIAEGDQVLKRMPTYFRAFLARALSEVALGRPAKREGPLAIGLDQSDPVTLTAGLVLARSGNNAAALKLADVLAKRLEADPQAYALLLRAE